MRWAGQDFRHHARYSCHVMHYIAMVTVNQTPWWHSLPSIQSMYFIHVCTQFSSLGVCSITGLLACLQAVGVSRMRWRVHVLGFPQRGWWAIVFLASHWANESPALEHCACGRGRQRRMSNVNEGHVRDLNVPSFNSMQRLNSPHRRMIGNLIHYFIHTLFTKNGVYWSFRWNCRMNLKRTRAMSPFSNKLLPFQGTYFFLKQTPEHRDSKLVLGVFGAPWFLYINVHVKVCTFPWKRQAFCELPSCSSRLR